MTSLAVQTAKNDMLYKVTLTLKTHMVNTAKIKTQNTSNVRVPFTFIKALLL